MLYILTKNIFYKWQESYVFCPYVNNEYLYMAKNLKPFSAFFENYDFVTENVMPEFEPLVQNGTVLKTEKEFFTQSRYGKIKTLRVFYYYPNGEWRMHRWNIIHDNIPSYQNSIDIRNGILYGYPKHYIRRLILAEKGRKILMKYYI